MKHDRRDPYFAAGLTAFAVIAAALVLFFLLYHASGVAAFFSGLAYILRPIFLGMILAFLLLPIHRRILRIMMADQRMNGAGNRFLNIVAIILSMTFAALVCYLLLAMVLPQVWQSLVDLVDAFPGYTKSAQAWLMAFLEDNPDIQYAVVSVLNSASSSVEQWLDSHILPNLESISSTLDWLRTEVLPNVTGVVTGVSTVLVAVLMLLKDLLIAVIVAVYLLARKDTFAAQSKKVVYSLLRTDHADLLVKEAREAYRIMSGFINGKILDSLIIGIICLVCCNLFKFPYPALVSTIIGVTNVVPFFGPFIGAIPCILLIFLVSPIQCVYFAIFILALQQFDGNILGPKILGGSTGLASFWVLFSIILFGGLFGFAGMVLGVPVFAMLYSVASRLVSRGLARKGLPGDTREYMGPTGPFGQEKPSQK